MAGEAGKRLLPRCKDSRNPNWDEMGGYCLTHQQPLDSCRDEMVEAVTAERERIRDAVEGLPGVKYGNRVTYDKVYRLAVLAIVNREDDKDEGDALRAWPEYREDTEER